jgi:TP901 family phage tail tape measure protein
MSGNILNFGIGVDLSGLTRNTNEASSLITNFTNSNEEKLKKFGEKATEIGDKFKGLSVVLAGFATVSIYQFGQIDKSLREVNSLFGLTGEAAEKNFGELVNISKEASKEVGILQQDISKGLYDAISAGVPKDNAFDFIVTAGKAAIGGVTDLSTSVDGLTTVINAYGKDFSEVGAVADSIFATVQGGKTTFAELSASLFNIAPAAAAAKVSMEEVNASIATLTASGTPTSVATTQIRAALTGLQRPSAEMDRIFQKLGFQNAQLAIESRGLKFALEAVKEASQGNNGELQTLLGSVEAVAAVNILAGTGSEKFTAELERQANAAGSASLAYDELNKSFPRQLERLKVQFSNISIEIGQRLAPLVGMLASGLGALGSLWDKLDESTKDIVVTFGILLAAIAPIALIIGKLIALAPALASAWAVITGPIGLVVAGVVALTVAIVKNWSTVRQWAEDIANYFVELYNKSIVFRAGIELTILSLKNIFNVGKFVFSTLTEVVSLAVKNMATALKGLGGIIEGVFTFDYQKIKDSFNQVFREGFGNIKTAFKNIGKDAVDTFENIGKDAGVAFDRIMGNTLEKVSFEPIKDKIKDAVSDGVTEGLAQGVGGGGGRSKTQGVGNVQGAGFTDTGINAQIPEIVKQADQGFIDFLIRVQQFEQDVNNLVQGSITNAFIDLGDAIGNALANGGNVFQAIGMSIISSMGKFLSSFGDQLISFAIASKAFAKLQLSLANPATALASAGVALAAGIALKAVGSAIASRAQSGFGGGGGAVGSSSVNTPQSNISSNTFVSNENNEVVFRISGNDLVGVLNRNNNQNARLG